MRAVREWDRVSIRRIEKRIISMTDYFYNRSLSLYVRDDQSCGVLDKIFKLYSFGKKEMWNILSFLNITSNDVISYLAQSDYVFDLINILMIDSFDLFKHTSILSIDEVKKPVARYTNGYAFDF